MKARHTSLMGMFFCVLLALGNGCGESQHAPESQATIKPPDSTSPSQRETSGSEPGEVKPTMVQPKTVGSQRPVPPGDQAKEKPDIQIENPEFDLGVIGPNTKHRCTFHFKNVGDAELKITRVTSTCSCAVAELTKKDYAPGEEGTVIVTYTAGSSASAVHKTLYIVSNDPKQPSAPLRITGTIRLKIAAEPMSLQFSAGDENAGAVPIRIYSMDETAFAIKNITATNDAVTFDYDPDKSATEFTLQPKVEQSKLEKSLHGYIRIQTSHPEVPTLTITWTAKPCITLSQPRFILQNAEPGQAVTRTVWVTDNCGGNLEIASVESTKGMMEIANQEMKDGYLKLEVRITPPPRKDQVMRYISDALAVKFTDGRSATIYCTGWYKMR